MSNILKCTNPGCKTLITVPVGALQVICPSCNTWHFPDKEEVTEDAPVLGLSDNYMIPPTPNITNRGEPDGLPNYTQNNNPSKEGAKSLDKLSASSIAYLIGIDGRQLPLKEGKNIIGRKGDDVILDDKTVSRRHCVIEVILSSSKKEWDYYIYDIGYLGGHSSTNGVLISGRSLRLQNYERLPIRNEMAIQLGNVKLVLMYQ